MDSITPHIVFTGGGTAGHLFPGLSVARQLAAMATPPKVTFVGSGRAFEAKHAAEAGCGYFSLPCAPAIRGMRSMWRFFTANVSGYREARRLLRAERPHVVVGLGGYASVPMTRAAISAGLPVVLLEQNAYPGKATRWLAPRAELVCAAFEQVREHLHNAGPVRITGNPLRSGFRPSRFDRSMQTERRLLVLGGSGGAHSLNEAVPRALYKLDSKTADWQIVHQSGSAEVATTQRLYDRFGLRAQVVSFIDNLPQVMRRADLAVCRAGGMTLAELAATGTPAVVVPYPHAADDHQRHNAEAFVNAGAARMVVESESRRLDDSLADALSDLMSENELRRRLTEAMLRLGRPDAAWHVAMMVYDLACAQLLDRAA